MSFTTNINGDKAALTATGALTVRGARELRQTLLDAINSPASKLVLDLSGVAEADISCIQILCAAHKSALARKMEMKVIGYSAEMEEALVASGTLQFEGCQSHCKDSCLWLASRFEVELGRGSGIS